MLSLMMRYYHTLKFLQWTQIKHRLIYQLQKNVETSDDLDPDFKSANLIFEHGVKGPTQFLHKNTFEFLNIKYSFDKNIDWNYEAYGKLWTYNLTYFEFLDQAEMSKDEGLRLIHDFISNEKKIKDGMEPFPISLRCLFWIKFLIKHQIEDEGINRSLFRQLQRLSKRPEYHLLGNHLLENGFSLLFGACYFKDEALFQQAEQILNEQLDEQILPDGAHFELSPMYHQIMLYRLLDVINLLQSNNTIATIEFLHFLKKKASLMLGWLQQITFTNDDIPYVNDSAKGIAPTTSQLLSYANQISLGVLYRSLNQCGYRKIRKSNFEIFIDVGSIGPDYIPGHAHSDTFNLIVYHQSKPVLVDTGISTYEKNPRRNLERSTSSHNTVMINDIEQSEVWGGFRVARRAKISSLEESETKIKATHDGYQKINCSHQRTFFFDKNPIQIFDEIKGSEKGKAFFHFHSSVAIQLKGNKAYGDFGSIEFVGADHIEIQIYQLATGFNQTVDAKRAVVFFNKQLRTKLLLL